MFLPASQEEMKRLGWDRADVVLVTGDAYVDAPQSGAAVIGRVLAAAGFRVGIIAQPDVSTDADIRRLGEPRLFWGVTSGCVDSLVANRTALGKRIRSDDFTPGGENNRRPDRAVIKYANLIRAAFSGTAPIVLGGLEASLRRFSHFDAWPGSVRRSILFDAKADLLVYGMGERAALSIARAMDEGRDWAGIPGTCLAMAEAPPGSLTLPSHEAVRSDPALFAEAFGLFSENQLPESPVLCQRQDTRFLVQYPPAAPPTQAELDQWNELPYMRDAHPLDARQGEVRALATIRFSITSHRGCFGDCRFCAISTHQGRQVVSRSPESVVREAQRLAGLPGFTGIISDLGGPTANMYGTRCKKHGVAGACSDRSCLFPEPCPHLAFGHRRHGDLLARVADLPGVRKTFVASGVRHDLVLADPKGPEYLARVLERHLSGQMKIAPEHCAPQVLSLMGKPGPEGLLHFRELYGDINARLGRDQFLTYYFMAAHPGCSRTDMEALSRFVRRELAVVPRQVQIFTPTPGTWSTCMFHTGRDPEGQKIFVERTEKGRAAQKACLGIPKGKGSRGKGRGGRGR
ncbi:MAG: YgiQ family radical SAM protein [Proteobacteria bacterium]|nr:YgiQ family radical SAM protein [Pseudomonadota bacterium]